MIFLRKNKKIKLTFHTCEQKPFKDLFAPVQSMSGVPEWWRQIPKQDFPTMRSCPGFIELFKNSISIPLWRDHEITYQSDRIVDMAIAGVHPERIYHYVQQHDPRQWGESFKGRVHLKFMNPWLVTCDKPTKFLLTGAAWHNKDFEDWVIPPGVLEFKYQTGSHLNMFLAKSDEQKTIRLDAGSIMAYLIPLEDVEVEVETKQVSTDEWSQLLNYQWTFANVYNKTKKLLEGRK